MTTWQALSSPIGTVMNTGVSVIALNSSNAQLDLFARGTDFTLQYNSWNGTWNGWTSLGGNLATAPAAVSWGPNRIDVFMVDQKNASMSYISFNGTAWSSWANLGDISEGTIFASQPTAVSWGPGRIDLFVLGGASQCFHMAYDGAWHWEGNIGGSFTSQIAAVAWGANRLDIFALGQDYKMWHNWWIGTAAWNGWASVGNVSLISTPAAVSSDTGMIDIFAVGTDHSVWHISYNESQWTEWESLGMTSVMDVGACRWASGHLEVYAVGIDSAAWHKAWNGSAWSGWNPLGGVFESSITGLCSSANNVDLFGLGLDSAVSWAAVVAPTTSNTGAILSLLC